MPEPRTTPREHDVPAFQPGKPAPDDPRKESPMKDPPVNPDHDIEDPEPVRQAGGAGDQVLYDENRVPG
ncbi:MAG: hypothetical protein WDO68_14620 [Gammaproteobacteria bacterium]